MSKKFLSVIIALLIAMTVCFFVVACNNSGDDGGEEKEVGEQITSQEWRTAFSDESFDNFKLVLTMDTEQTDGMGIHVDGINFTATRADGKEYYYVDNITNGEIISSDEGYYDSINDVYYVKVDGKWETTDSNSGVGIDYYMDIITVYKEMYPVFHYDDSENGYVMASNYGGNNVKYIFKFKNKKIAYIYAESSVEALKSRITQEYVFTYGGQSVTLPKVENGKPENTSDEVSEEEWTAALSNDSFVNYTLKYSSSILGTTVSYVYNVTPEAIYGEGVALGSDEKATKMYVYGETIDGVITLWSKRETEEWKIEGDYSPVEVLLESVFTLRDKYDSYEYSKDTDSYKATDDTLEFVEVVFKQGKIVKLYLKQNGIISTIEISYGDAKVARPSDLPNE